VNRKWTNTVRSLMERLPASSAACRVHRVYNTEVSMWCGLVVPFTFDSIASSESSAPMVSRREVRLGSLLTHVLHRSHSCHRASLGHFL